MRSASFGSYGSAEGKREEGTRQWILTIPLAISHNLCEALANQPDWPFRPSGRLVPFFSFRYRLFATWNMKWGRDVSGSGLLNSNSFLFFPSNLISPTWKLNWKNSRARSSALSVTSRDPSWPPRANCCWRKPSCTRRRARNCSASANPWKLWNRRNTTSPLTLHQHRPTAPHHQPPLTPVR